MTGNPVFTGPVEDSVSSMYCTGGFYTDFHFECRVQYPQQTTDNGARFEVRLLFDGRLSFISGVRLTRVVTDGTALTVSFPSIALQGNVGKSVSTRILFFGLSY